MKTKKSGNRGIFYKKSLYQHRNQMDGISGVDSRRKLYDDVNKV